MGKLRKGNWSLKINIFRAVIKILVTTKNVVSGRTFLFVRFVKNVDNFKGKILSEGCVKIITNFKNCKVKNFKRLNKKSRKDVDHKGLLE